MAGIGPWLAVAGVGALHGLNPATGWGLVAAWGVRAGDRARAWRALAPVALGHAGAVALVAALAALGMAAGRGLLPWLAGGGAVFAAAVHVAGHVDGHARRLAGSTGLALWSLAVGSIHGAGMMLVPALVPLCVSTGPAREITASGSLVPALAVVALHLAAMLAVTAALAGLVGGGWIALRGRPHRRPCAAQEAPLAAEAAGAAGTRRASTSQGSRRWPKRTVASKGVMSAGMAK